MAVHGIKLRTNGFGKFGLGERGLFGEIVVHRDVLPPDLAVWIPAIAARLQPVLHFVWSALGADPYRASIRRLQKALKVRSLFGFVVLAVGRTDR